MAAAVLVLIAGGGALVSWLFKPAPTGTLLVQASAQGVDVFVDGHARGAAPVTVQLPAGRHAVELRGHGAARTIIVEVAAGQQITRRVNWSEGHSSGSLKVTSTPEGAR